MGQQGLPGTEPVRRYCFGEFTLDLDRAVLLRGRRIVKLRKQSFDVLRYLVEHHGRIVEKGELLEEVWGSKAVTDDSLTHCLIDIRKAIGDSTREMIRTVPRRGFVFEMPVQPVANLASSAHQQRYRNTVAAVLAVLLILGGTSLFNRTQVNRVELLATPVPPNSVAVLPFQDISVEQQYGYLADGVAEEILNSLVRYTGLDVVARTSSFQYRDELADVTEIAAALGVAHIVEGSVRVIDGNGRITAQLISGDSGMHIWSHTYDVALDDILEAQRETADSISRHLSSVLAGGVDVAQVEFESSSTLDLYVQARFLFNRRADGDIGIAKDLYLQALELEPESAAAWAGLAGTYYIEYIDDDRWDAGLLDSFKDSAETAVALGPGLAEGWLRLSLYYRITGDTGSADRYQAHAEALDPDDPLLLGMLAGQRASGGDLRGAIEMQRRALTRNPLSVIDRNNLSFYLYAAGRYEEAILENRQAQLLRHPDDAGAESLQGYALIKLARYEEALQVVEAWPPSINRDAITVMARLALSQYDEARDSMHRLLSDRTLEGLLRQAELHAFCEEFDKSFAALQDFRQELQQASDPLGPLFEIYADLRWSPFLEPVRDDPRWQRWIKDVANLTLVSSVAPEERIWRFGTSYRPAVSAE